MDRSPGPGRAGCGSRRGVPAAGQLPDEQCAFLGIMERHAVGLHQRADVRLKADELSGRHRDSKQTLRPLLAAALVAPYPTSSPMVMMLLFVFIGIFLIL